MKTEPGKDKTLTLVGKGVSPGLAGGVDGCQNPRIFGGEGFEGLKFPSIVLLQARAA